MERLIGDERQVAMAERIRSQALGRIQYAAEDLIENQQIGSLSAAMDGADLYQPVGQEAIEQYRAAVEVIAGELKLRIQAADWIRGAADEFGSRIIGALNQRCSQLMPAVHAEMVAAGRGSEVK